MRGARTIKGDNAGGPKRVSKIRGRFPEWEVSNSGEGEKKPSTYDPEKRGRGGCKKNRWPLTGLYDKFCEPKKFTPPKLPVKGMDFLQSPRGGDYLNGGGDRRFLRSCRIGEPESLTS